jgi:hypothetical protein
MRQRQPVSVGREAQLVTGYPRARFAGALRALLGAALAMLLVTASPAAALEQKLTAADGAALDTLGTSVSIDGQTIVVGAPGDEAGRGSVYVFQRSGDSWTNTAKLSASDGAPGDRLGSSVAINGNTIVAGAPGDTIVANRAQGSLYTFARTGAAVRSETAKLTVVDGATGDNLGTSAPRRRSTATRSSAVLRAASSANMAARARCTHLPTADLRRARRRRS